MESYGLCDRVKLLKCTVQSRWSPQRHTVRSLKGCSVPFHSPFPPPICLSPSPQTSLPHLSLLPSPHPSSARNSDSNLNDVSQNSLFLPTPYVQTLQHSTPLCRCTEEVKHKLSRPTSDSKPKATSHSHPPTVHHTEGTFPLQVCACDRKAVCRSVYGA